MMQKKYCVNGRYMARYPDGHHTGLIGISARVKASDKQAAKKRVSRKAMKMHGYVRFDWLEVDANQVQ